MTTPPNNKPQMKNESESSSTTTWQQKAARVSVTALGLFAVGVAGYVVLRKLEDVVMDAIEEMEYQAFLKRTEVLPMPIPFTSFKRSSS